MVALLFAMLFDPLPDAEVAKEIAARVEALSSPRFAVREAATKRLAAIGSLAKGHLRAALTHPDAEVVTRASILIEDIAEAEAQTLWPLPQLDSLWYDVVEKRYRYEGTQYERLDPILGDHGRGGCPWPNYYAATDAVVRKWLANGASCKQLRPLLAAMHARDAVFLSTKPAIYEGSPLPPAVNWWEYIEGGK